MGKRPDKHFMDFYTTADFQVFQDELSKHHRIARSNIIKILIGEVFDSQKAKSIVEKLRESLFLDQNPEIGVGFDKSKESLLRRFFVSLKAYLFMPLSEEELQILNKTELDDESEGSTDFESSEAAETDDESEVSTDFESSEEDEEEDDEGFKTSDPDVPWDDGDEEPR